MNIIKIAWICHFSNQEVREQLTLSEMRLFNFLKSLLKKKKSSYVDFSPWINNLIQEFKNFNEIELHVISPHKGLIPFSCEFEMQNIYYHFYKPEVFFWLKKLLDKVKKNRKKRFLVNRYLIQKFIKKINPDIVNLIGTENPYYSIASLDIKNIPVYISAQTVYTNPLRRIHSDSFNKLNWDTELKIHKKEKYFGCSGRMHRDLILRNNPEAIIFKNFFPIQKPHQVKELKKEYDFVFFAAGVTKKKGIEDALDALAIVKRKKHDVTLNVVGRCVPEYFEFLKSKIKECNLLDNVKFDDYFPKHEDMHQHVKKSRFALLPVKLDVIPGTVLEAILLDLPVVTYKTTGTPYLNKDGQAVLLAEIGNIEKLAENMLKLIESPGLADKLRKNAGAVVEKEFDNTTSAKRLVKNYKAVLDHYHRNKPIPQELLFNTEEFPLY